MKPHSYYLDQTLLIAKKSILNGNHPFGALIVFEDEIICTSENLVISNEDVTAHAELNLVRISQKKFSSDILKKSVLYTSTEPCAMCAGAIYWSNIQSIVYGCSNKNLCKIVGGSLEASSTSIWKQGVKNIKSIHIPNRTYDEIHLEFWDNSNESSVNGSKEALKSKKPPIHSD